MRNINNVGCGTLENRKERWRREFANFLVSNDPHLPEILIWRNQFFTSNVRGKDLVRNINTECNIEYIWRRGNNVESARVNFLDSDDPYRQSQNIFCGTHQGHTFLIKSVKILDREQNWIKYSGKETVYYTTIVSQNILTLDCFRALWYTRVTRDSGGSRVCGPPHHSPPPYFWTKLRPEGPLSQGLDDRPPPLPIWERLRFLFTANGKHQTQVENFSE